MAYLLFGASVVCFTLIARHIRLGVIGPPILSVPLHRDSDPLPFWFTIFCAAIVGSMVASLALRLIS